MPKKLVATFAVLITIQVPPLIIYWRQENTGEVAFTGMVIGFLVGLAAAVWMNHTIRG